MLLNAALLFSLAALAPLPAHAFFRLPCEVLVKERVDPIIAPKAVAGHTHTIRPPKELLYLMSGHCRQVWSPQLYFLKKDGSVESVKGGNMLVYYLFRSHSSDKAGIQAFPDNFKMLAGNPFTRTYSAAARKKDTRFSWNCLGSAPPTVTPGLPTRDCPGGLRAEIRFPSCYNGKAYKADQSHVAYPSDGETGPCPSTHTIRIPTLFFEVFYSVDDFKDRRKEAKNPKSPFVLAMGDPTGYGIHGDFLNGWDRSILTKAIKQCNGPNDSGEIEDCKVLKLYDRTKLGVCHKTPDVNEAVEGKLKKLPGCNPVTSTTAAAQKAPGTCPNLVKPKLFSSPVAYFGDVAPPGSQVLSTTSRVLTSWSGWKYTGCYYHPSGRYHLTAQLSIKDKNVQTCVTAAKAAGYTYVGLEYGGECWVGKSQPGTAAKLKSEFARCDMPCERSPTQICGGSNAMTVYKLTTTKKRHLDAPRIASH